VSQIFVARRDNARAIFRKVVEAKGGVLPADRYVSGAAVRARGSKSSAAAAGAADVRVCAVTLPPRS
jgi:hypothetical protein